MVSVYLTKEQIAELYRLTFETAYLADGVQIETDASNQTAAQFTAVRSRDGVLDNDHAHVEATGASTGWER